MFSKNTLEQQLKGTITLIDWSIALVLVERLLDAPPHGEHPKADPRFSNYFGQWSAYRLLFHLVHYESTIALPAMMHWLGDPAPIFDLMDPNRELEKTAWNEELEQGPDLTNLLDRFHTCRQEQIVVLRAIPDKQWGVEKLNTMLGKVSAAMVVSKTIQHTLEHGSDILKNALYWDRALEWLESRG
jgi:hypothetical protein